MIESINCLGVAVLYCRYVAPVYGPDQGWNGCNHVPAVYSSYSGEGIGGL